MKGFNETTLGQILMFQRGFDITKKEQTFGRIPIVSSSGISSYHSEFKVEGPGVVIGRKGTLGTVHFIAQNFWPHDTTLWIKDFKGNDPKFIYYFLQTLHLEKFDTGSSNPTLNRNHVHKIKVLFPNIVIQKKIAAILSAYDDLIENNKKRIQILESMAEELYKEWFVRFRFPNWENTEFEKGVPKAWDIKSLDELAAYINGYPFSPDDWGNEGLPIIKIKELNNGVCSDTPYFSNDLSEKYRINSGDILFSWSGSLIVQRWSNGSGWLNQHLFKVVPNQIMTLELFFYHLKNSIPYLEVLTTGATMKHIKRKELKQVKVLVPSEDVQIKFRNFIEPLWKELDLLSSQLKILINLKSDLLPRLISGKLSVQDLDIQFPPLMIEQ
ncbi:restriction endonuclease subunit S [Acinetobacter baumannii]|uniref:restriction endonuclease subunit S n=1 Tax=Acinetobacter calcoaceticus/baumannii complex TaxID=909768 RepID=UPI0021CD5EB3|nr:MULTISPECIES: restriction endonuclease subunit S [Acinetobacter calcoaceticus/baumannii complex]MCU4549328.1 restriction endonuclease subunit S [Acinetobacter pittii]MDC5074987.1 restriction endonuclease subunit S [Acinetobacter baumannii]MDK2106955.1 restriction endonuclease subunit S [Acinetobacter baumannii]MDK2112290.1 restriction endonuclease subunit S [Acinetobacter baumannii]MDK2141801.1 restriction endonuclease subunit S [Acinetobacter baumannii]